MSTDPKIQYVPDLIMTHLKYPASPANANHAQRSAQQAEKRAHVCHLTDPFLSTAVRYSGSVHDDILRSYTPHPVANPPSEYEVALVEEHEMTAGPLSLLQTATRTHTQVLISCRNNRKVR